MQRAPHLMTILADHRLLSRRLIQPPRLKHKQQLIDRRRHRHIPHQRHTKTRIHITTTGRLTTGNIKHDNTITLNTHKIRMRPPNHRPRTMTINSLNTHIYI